MNAKELYLTIGQIGDDLILGANEECGRKKKPVLHLWMAAAAACLCLVCCGGYLHFFGTVAVWNTGATEYVTKSSIPENSTIQDLSASSLRDYYHITLAAYFSRWSLRGRSDDLLFLTAQKSAFQVRRILDANADILRCRKQYRYLFRGSFLAPL